jgi:hypothetical protein
MAHLQWSTPTQLSSIVLFSKATPPQHQFDFPFLSQLECTAYSLACLPFLLELHGIAPFSNLLFLFNLMGWGCLLIVFISNT